MKRTFLVLSAGALIAGCSMTPTVTKERMTLAEANISGMECRREVSVNSSIPKTTCASREVWARYDKRQSGETELFFSAIRDDDNRMLGRGR